MNIREASIQDISQIQIIRNAVRENQLSNPNLVTDQDCIDYITRRGKGWVAEYDGNIVGFAIVDLQDHNIWALFVHPHHEGQGAGRLLHDTMLNWYFAQSTAPIWLGTAPETRAEKFYHKAGWKEIGVHGKGEVKFQMTYEDWTNKSLSQQIYNQS